MIAVHHRTGFTLIELLVALAIFSTMAALAYGGLAAVVRTRQQLQAQQDAFAQLVRTVSILERDLREIAARPIRGNYGERLPVLLGNVDNIEFTRFGYANPLAEARSNLERVEYLLDNGTLKRGAFAVLDRAPNSLPQLTDLRGAVTSFRLRYLDFSNRWLDVWPVPNSAQPDQLPRAVEFKLTLRDYGDVSRLVEMPSSAK
jgi:general secretion pathway protein J